MKIEAKRIGSGWLCPHCKDELVIRTSETYCDLMRIYYMQCKGIDCSATFKAAMEITVQLSPSGLSNPIIAEQLLKSARNNVEKITCNKSTQ